MPFYLRTRFTSARFTFESEASESEACGSEARSQVEGHPELPVQTERSSAAAAAIATLDALLPANALHFRTLHFRMLHFRKLKLMPFHIHARPAKRYTLHPQTEFLLSGIFAAELD